MLLAGSSLLACGSDAKSTDDATVETYTTVPDAQVVSGLAGDPAADGRDGRRAGHRQTRRRSMPINNSWLVYEGNIRINDATAHLPRAEDALALFSKAALGGDTAGMSSSADKFGPMAPTYTAAHPG